MALQFNTVAIPVTKGIDLRTAARLVEAPGLLRAENARFGKGSQKRFGYRQHKAVLGTPGFVRHLYPHPDALRGKDR